MIYMEGTAFVAVFFPVDLTQSPAPGHVPRLGPFPFVCGANYEDSELTRAPLTNGPRDVPRCGAISLLYKSLHNKGGSAEIVTSFCVCGPCPSFNLRPR